MEQTHDNDSHSVDLQGASSAVGEACPVRPLPSRNKADTEFAADTFGTASINGFSYPAPAIQSRTSSSEAEAAVNAANKDIEEHSAKQAESAHVLESGYAAPVAQNVANAEFAAELAAPYEAEVPMPIPAGQKAAAASPEVIRAEPGFPEFDQFNEEFADMTVDAPVYMRRPTDVGFSDRNVSSVHYDRRVIADSKGFSYGLLGIIVAVIAMFMLPGILGPAAAVLGIISYRRGRAISGGLAIVLGMIAFIGFLFWAG